MKQTTKDFDCVKLQRNIRDALTKKYKDLPLKEMGKRMTENLSKDPRWASFLKKASSHKKVKSA